MNYGETNDPKKRKRPYSDESSDESVIHGAEKRRVIKGGMKLSPKKPRGPMNEDFLESLQREEQ